MTTASHNIENDGSILGRFPFRHGLDTGDTGVLVLWVQSRLAEIGLYGGPLNGKYGRETSLSVRVFQRDNKLAITGAVDRKVWDALCRLEL